MISTRIFLPKPRPRLTAMGYGDRAWSSFCDRDYEIENVDRETDCDLDLRHRRFRRGDDHRRREIENGDARANAYGRGSEIFVNENRNDA